jgi:hypothetical protein
MSRKYALLIGMVTSGVLYAAPAPPKQDQIAAPAPMAKVPVAAPAPAKQGSARDTEAKHGSAAVHTGSKQGSATDTEAKHGSAAVHTGGTTNKGSAAVHTGASKGSAAVHTGANKGSAGVPAPSKAPPTKRKSSGAVTPEFNPHLGQKADQRS